MVFVQLLTRFRKINQAFLGLLAALLLTGCAGFGGVASLMDKSSNIDLNADVESIGLGVSRFDANSALVSSASTLQDYLDISENNELILDSITESVQTFNAHINEAWVNLPAEDSSSSPSREKLLRWAEGYESWIYYQREIQKLGSACAVISQTKSEYDSCAINNFNRSFEFERLSKIELTIAVQEIQEWQASVGVSNG